MNPTPANPLTALLADLPPLLPRIEAYLDHWATTTPNAEALVDSGRRLSFAQLRDAVHLAARRLAAFGVDDGACVAVLAPPCADAFVSFLAANLLGATWLGLNPKYTRSELAMVIDDARPTVTLAYSRIGERDYLDDLRGIFSATATRGISLALLDRRAEAPELEAFGARGEQAFERATHGNDIALLVYTSGTTGRPKAARLPHRALVRAAAVRAKVWQVSPFRAINNLPINHVGGMGDIACTTLVAGGCQVCLERFSPTATLDCLQGERISYWYQVPTMFQMCLDAASDRAMDWSHLQAAIWSGGRASRQLVDRLAAVADYLAVDYSMTESVGVISMAPLTTTPEQMGEHVGWPDPGRNLRLVDPASGVAAASGQAGEVQIRDAWMFAGYGGDAPPADAFTDDGWFRTGDLATCGADGCWRIVGRSKEMFKSGGYNVYPREVELVLEAQLGVGAVAVVETPDPLYGEVGVAFLVANGTPPAASVLEAHCRQHLANYKIPKRFVFVDTLPMLPIGKVDKVALRKAALTIPG